MQRSIIMGRNPTNEPLPVRVDANGNLIVAGGGATQEVRIVDVAGDSCMDEANNAARVNIVAGGLVGAVTVADGADVAEGATTDAEAAAGNGTIIALLKRLRTLLGGTLTTNPTDRAARDLGKVDIADIDGFASVAGQKTKAASFPVTLASDEDTLNVDTELAAAAALADGMANPTVPIVGAGEMLFNGTTWDRRRNNTEEVPFASAARTGGSWVDLVNYNARGAIIILNVTAITDTPSIHLEVWIWDPASNQRETLLVGGAVTAVGRHSYIVYPGCGPAANDIDTVAAYPLPLDWAVGMLHADADSITYSVGVVYIL